MKYHGKMMVCLLIAGFVLSFTSDARAQGIKARMRARLPVIVSLKAQGIVGENNQGYLSILKKPTDKQATITAENKDRRAIYSAIAKKQGTTVQLVGQRRALQISQKAVPGTMIQDAKGNWRKK